MLIRNPRSFRGILKKGTLIPPACLAHFTWHPISTAGVLCPSVIGPFLAFYRILIVPLLFRETITPLEPSQSFPVRGEKGYSHAKEPQPPEKGQHGCYLLTVPPFPSTLCLCLRASILVLSSASMGWWSKWKWTTPPAFRA